MLPAHLPSLDGQPAVTRESIRDCHAVEVCAEQLARDGAAAAAVDAKHGDVRRRRGPQPRVVPRLSPALLVRMHDGGATHMRPRYLDGRRDRATRFSLDVADGSESYVDVEAVFENGLRRSLREPALAAQERDHRAQPHAEAERRRIARQLGPRGRSASAAAQCVQSVLDHERLYHRQLHNLTTHPRRDLASERALTAATACGLHVVSLVDFLDGNQLASMTSVPWLPSGLAPARRCLRPFHARRIGRRRLRRVRRVLRQLRFQPAHLGHQLQDPKTIASRSAIRWSCATIC